MRNANLIVKAGMLATCLPFIGCNSANKSEKSQEERPNILFILSDDHTGQAWGDLRRYSGRLCEEREYPPPGRRRLRAG